MTNTQIHITETTLCHDHEQVPHSIQQDLDWADTVARAGFTQLHIGHTKGLGAEQKPAFPMALSHGELIERLRSQCLETKLIANADPDLAELNILQEARAKGLDSVRIAIDPLAMDPALTLMENAISTGLGIRAVFTFAGNLSRQMIRQAMARIDSFKPETVMLEDTTGSMTPLQVRHKLQMMRDHGASAPGFAGHNGLGMATANALAAIEAHAFVLEYSIGRPQKCIETVQMILAMDRAGLKTGIPLDGLAQFCPREWPDILCAWAGITSDLASDLVSTAKEFDISAAGLAARVCESTGGLSLDHNALRALAQTEAWSLKDQISHHEERAHAS